MSSPHGTGVQIFRFGRVWTWLVNHRHKFPQLKIWTPARLRFGLRQIHLWYRKIYASVLIPHLTYRCSIVIFINFCTPPCPPMPLS